MTQEILLRTELPDVKLLKRGKVRDIYDLGDKLLIVATDRISCFDVVLPQGIPYKGKILNKLTVFWLGMMDDIIKTHFLTDNLNDYPPELEKYKPQLSGRSMLVNKAQPLPVECVVRGYLSGSGWKEYCENQTVCGISLPAGLKESEMLAEPIFTPATKEEVGHDINVSMDFVGNKIGPDLAHKLKDKSILIYTRARNFALVRGIIIADTKFEFGLADNGRLILIDELLTPDSSRFWPDSNYTPGQPQPSFDKQFVRNYLETLGWDKNPPAPNLPLEIIEKTSEKYLKAYRRITGKDIGNLEN